MRDYLIAIALVLIFLLVGNVAVVKFIAFNEREKALEQCKGKFKNKRPKKEEFNQIIKVTQHEEINYLRNSKAMNILSLCGAWLDRADLSKAFLSEADLSGASLWGTNLSGAWLDRADLSGADLHNTNLSGAFLYDADLKHVIFEPADIPEIRAIAYARNLALMKYINNQTALLRLRKMFKENGFYEQERKITYAIKHTETIIRIKKGGWNAIEGVFHYYFFDLTTFWGSEPRRALLILLALIPVFAIHYTIALLRPGKNGIWRKWVDDRVRSDLGTEKPELLQTRDWRQALGWGLYFSVLSAFNIGWREFKVGNWIQRLQPKEYTLRATGWARTVSGVQALISVYLFAIWVLTYFGRPFD